MAMARSPPTTTTCSSSTTERAAEQTATGTATTSHHGGRVSNPPPLLFSRSATQLLAPTGRKGVATGEASLRALTRGCLALDPKPRRGERVLTGAILRTGPRRRIATFRGTDSSPNERFVYHNAR